jgi:hypothetical protein
LVLVAAVVGVPTSAVADPPTTESDRGVDIFCEGPDGFLSIFVHEGEGHGFLDVSFEPFENGVHLFGGTEDFDFDGTDLAAEVEMFLGEHHEENGENGENGNGEPVPVGTAVIGATLAPIGEPEIFEDRFRDGNRWITIVETFQELAVTGFATLEGFFDVDLSECSGGQFEHQFSSTNPNAFNGRFEGHFLECSLEDTEAFGFLFADTGDFGTFVDVFIETPEGVLSGFTEDATFTDTELTAVVRLFEDHGENGENGNGGPVAEAVVDGTLVSQGTSTSEIIFQNGRVKSIVETFDVSGTVVVNGLALDMVDCFSESFADRVHFSNPSGPKPGGNTPDNDLPEGAASLETRESTNAQNKAASPAPEASCVVTFEGEENGNDEPEDFPVPLGNTLWYSFEGTGGPVTIDSAGSNFDTVIGIYDQGINQLACVDDVGDETGFSLQAAVTVDTQAGTTYLVQIGGFGFFDDPEFPSVAEIGRLRLSKS